MCRPAESARLRKFASVVSGHKKVREKLLDLQRRLGREASKGAVLEGRDIGTVVFPNAKFKFFKSSEIWKTGQNLGFPNLEFHENEKNQNNCDNCFFQFQFSRP